VAQRERRQNIARLREIGEVAARHGFGFLLDRRRSADGAIDTEAGHTRGERLRAMLDELGPTFVKFGQLLSTRPDIVPPDIVRELRSLQDDARPFPAAVAREAIHAELGLSVEQVFEEFDDQPIAAASIGQVHVARLPEGRQVAVKVQRPDAEEKLRADLALLEQVAKIAKERVKRLEFIDTVALVNELGRSVRHELDYRVEARNVEATRRAFTGDPTVVVPSVYWRYTTSRLLVLEWVDGTTLNHTDLDIWSAEDRRRLAARISETWMKMVFVNGFFHADPHPANIVVRDPDTIGLVDFGMVGQLSPRDRQAAVHLFIDVVDQNLERLPRRLRELGLRYPKHKDDEFREQLDIILQRYWGASMGEIDGRELVRDIFQAIYRLQIKLPTRWVLLDKALATLAGVGLQISPDFNVFDTARPYARRLMVQRFRPDVAADRVQGDLGRYAEAFMAFPFQLHDLMDELRDGEVKIAIQQEGFTESTERALGATNRIVLGVLAAALFLGSAIIGGFIDRGPHLLGVAVVAIPGLVAGASLAGLVMFGILKSGRW
jgi:ubiquinone biosynthesis protein